MQFVGSLCLKTKNHPNVLVWGMKPERKNSNLIMFMHFPFSLPLCRTAEMGCGLNKLEKHDEKRPGNIYSTLKRPQVETKIDVCYEYRFLDFTTLNDSKYTTFFFRFFFY